MTDPYVVMDQLRALLRIGRLSSKWLFTRVIVLERIQTPGPCSGSAGKARSGLLREGRILSDFSLSVT